MAPRAYWTGNIKVSLVTFGVRMYTAVSEAERVRLNQVHKGCNQRIKMPTTCPVHGQVDRSEIDKAYEVEKDKYVIIEQEELNRIKLRAEKTIDLAKFVPIDSVDDLYLDSSYFLAPDGPVADEPYRIFQEAMRSTRTAGIGSVVLASRERPVLLRPSGRGFVLSTLHAGNEVVSAAPYFADMGEAPVRKEYMELAVSLIKQKQGAFEPAEFRDRYQEALVELVKSKVAGQQPVIIQEEDLPATFNFAEALQQSLAGSAPAAMVAAAPAALAAAAAAEPARAAKNAKVPKGAKKPPAASEPAAAPAAAKRPKRKQA